MAWRLAHSLEKLRLQVNSKYPNRSKSSDGSIGDENHATRSSDHNPWVKDGAVGVVTAIDITNDPKNGFDSEEFAQMLLDNRDARLKYVISNRKIGSGGDGPQPWTWRKYSGANPHDHHCHISVKSDKPHYDSTADWRLSDLPEVPPVIAAGFMEPPETLRKGSKGDLVKRLQAGIGAAPDGDFGPRTESALKKFQVDHGLLGDGIAGPQTWKLIP